MRDVFTACGMHRGNVSCFVVNDGSVPWSGSVSVQAVDLSTGTSTILLNKQVSLRAGPGARVWFAPHALPDPATHAVVVSDSAGSEMVASLAPLNAMALKQAQVSCTVGAAHDAYVNITCTADAVAAYVVLTTAAYGRFEPNAFLLTNTREVQFISWTTNGTADVNLLKSSLRVDHARKWPMYVPPPPPPPSPPLPKHWQTCQFQKNVDWNVGARCPQQPAKDPATCCALCNATASCVASTFAISTHGQGNCFFKSAKDVAKGLRKTTKTCVACVPH
jgi:hypothetical protein